MTSTVSATSVSTNSSIVSKTIPYMSTTVIAVIIPAFICIGVVSFILHIYKKKQEGHFQGKNTTAIIPNVRFENWIGHDEHKDLLRRDFVVPYNLRRLPTAS